MPGPALPDSTQHKNAFQRVVQNFETIKKRIVSFVEQVVLE